MPKNLEKYLWTHDEKRDDRYDFIIYEHHLPAVRNIPLHWHDYLEFEFIAEGQMEHIYNDQQYLLDTGSAYLMCYYDFHELTALTEVRIYSIHFSQNLLAPEIFEHLGYNKFHCHFDETQTQQLERQLQKIIKEAEQKLPFYTLVIKNVINEIVISMIRKATNNEMPVTSLPTQCAVAYINEHFSEPITLEKMAKQLSFSTNYLGMLFKKQMGCTFNDYLNTLRLKHACNLLYSSDMSVKAISYAAGYSSVEYFTYAFKKKMLMTPNNYRKQQRKHQAD